MNVELTENKEKVSALSIQLIEGELMNIETGSIVMAVFSTFILAFAFWIIYKISNI